MKNIIMGFVIDWKIYMKQCSLNGTTLSVWITAVKIWLIVWNEDAVSIRQN